MQFFEFDSLGSTNAKAIELFQAGERGPFWVRADVQTAGRGRRGRDWSSPRGNLYASALYEFDGPPQDAAQLSFVASVALAKTFESYALRQAPILKWPNDVLLGGAKISGILLENIGGAVIVGIGVNLTSHPENTPYPATHLLAHITPEALNDPEPIFTGAAPFLALLAKHFDDGFTAFKTQGFAPIHSAWRARATNIPGPVTVNLDDETFRGTASDLRADGALRVTLDNGTVRDVYAGDVFFGENANNASSD
ncbi:biotin--[acetyl-CoA-carboxylase] ligase [Litorimonas sp. RW-G-Af-16]|uniref:biotin--[acetyl-CoA-carboxylase] ligase n=1 Tax=Litorimonas sp. RW-G-Af-16 TaxID=3241168 RepID=UPI00390CC8B4